MVYDGASYWDRPLLPIQRGRHARKINTLRHSSVMMIPPDVGPWSGRTKDVSFRWIRIPCLDVTGEGFAFSNQIGEMIDVLTSHVVHDPGKLVCQAECLNSLGSCDDANPVAIYRDLQDGKDPLVSCRLGRRKSPSRQPQIVAASVQP